MNTDPILQEVLAEFDKLTEFLEIRHGDGMQILPVRENDRAKLRDFLTSAVHRTREAAIEEAISGVPTVAQVDKPVYVNEETIINDIDQKFGWNACRAATLQALEGLKKK